MNKIYFSGSIDGVRHKDPSFTWKLAQYAIGLGFVVLDEEVVALTREKGFEIYLEKTGIDLTKINNPEPLVYKKNVGGVDQANYLIAIVDGPSHGVGMELMRALLKPKMGLNETKILCLLHKDNLPRLSWMIKGVSKGEYPNFEIKTYQDLESAKEIVKVFLTKQG